MFNLAKRTMRIYFRDKSAVFFSLMAVLIIIGLYVLFLGDVWTQGMDFENAKQMMDAWIMSGLLAVIPFTTTMGAFGIMIDDRHKKISKDFYSSPVRRSSLAGGYILGAFVIGVIMSVLAFILAEVYLVANGAAFPEFYTLLKIIGLIVLTSFSNTVLLFFIVSFLKSQNAFSTASSIIGTLIGFLTGIYLPIGMLPNAVQIVVKIFPVSHSAVLFRQIMMEPIMKDLPAEITKELNEQLGVKLYWGGEPISWVLSLVVVVATAVLFGALSTVNISRKKK